MIVEFSRLVGMADFDADGAGVYFRFYRMVSDLIIGNTADDFSAQPDYVMRTCLYLFIFGNVIEVVAIVYGTRSRIGNVMNDYGRDLFTLHTGVEIFICRSGIRINIE